MDLVRDATAIEPERPIYQGGPGDILGELNLLTGQNVYLTARGNPPGRSSGSDRRRCAVPSPSTPTP
ncbi:hypothetical protein [Actinomadura rugatobispora]|uniref:Uncharacterized protein n=1 Tax=Actinomadura rugatobispora TaxID=1994 RepID=A0ABW1A194_9ACTN|nr:hypothetical protein GCM10010200_083980 [Actinomadura rugatobispora]